MRRLWAATAAIVLCLALGAVPAAAQAEGGAEGITIEPLFKVDLGADGLPEDLSGVLVFRKVYPADMDISYGASFVPPNTFVRYVESGQLGLRSHGGMSVIRSGTTPPTIETVPAEADVTVGPGDVVVQADVPYEAYGHDALGTMWHEGAEDAVAVGFAIREASRCCAMTHAGMRSPWHATMAGDKVESLIGRPLTFRMDRVHIEPGATLPLATDEPPTMRLIDAGTLTATLSNGGDGDARSLVFASGRSFTDEALTRDLRFLLDEDRAEAPVLANLGEDPVVLLQLVIEPIATGSGNVAAPSDPPESGDLARETLFGLTIPHEMLPDRLEHVRVGRYVWAAGADSLIDPTDPSWQGRAILVESGELLVTPAIDGLMWHGGGGPAEIAPALEADSLSTGEAIYLPPMGASTTGKTGMLRIANPGSEDATALTLQMGPSIPMSGLPAGLTTDAWHTRLVWTEAMDSIGGHDALIRASRISAGPGSSMSMPEGAVVAFYHVEEGEAGYLVGDSPLPWARGHGIVSLPDEAVVVTGAGPAILLELTVGPVADG
jgi:hypothetical protein